MQRLGRTTLKRNSPPLSGKSASDIVCDKIHLVRTLRGNVSDTDAVNIYIYLSTLACVGVRNKLHNTRNPVTDGIRDNAVVGREVYSTNA